MRPSLSPAVPTPRRRPAAEPPIARDLTAGPAPPRPRVRPSRGDRGPPPPAEGQPRPDLGPRSDTRATLRRTCTSRWGTGTESSAPPSLSLLPPAALRPLTPVLLVSPAPLLPLAQLYRDVSGAAASAGGGGGEALISGSGFWVPTWPRFTCCVTWASYLASLGLGPHTRSLLTKRKSKP